MKIAFSSDNHLDINRVDVAAILPQMAAALIAAKVDYYVNTGDTFNDFTKTRSFYAQLQAQLGASVQVRYLAGNHDMVRGISYAELEELDDPLYLHNRAEQLPGTNATLVGNNGWYDYSFVPADAGVTPSELRHWKKAFWIDGVIEQPQSDAERMQAVLTQVRAKLAANAGRQIIFATHFVPQRAFLNPQMLQSEVGAKVAAFLGSQALGNLLTEAHVDTVGFGHLHRRDAARTIDGVRYLHMPVGYGTKRRHEWQSTDFMTEWRATLQVMTL
ncbi:metallophosphoesterase [Lacticaseibacillus hulanensis]|uniref:metallophosphoesterase n=1 Tax=Lacticaseibacillus hulanensis TaxID=2493111 RepID=UPI000FDC5DD7|nr:metallophosphoesterase [Lacticaseibacillus hulanensis]